MKLFLLVSVMAAMAATIPPAPEKVRQLLDAVRSGNTAVVHTLVQCDPVLVDARGPQQVSAVRLALYYRQTDIARFLIDRGAKLDIWDAAAAGRVERLRELVMNDPALVNTFSGDGATALGLAAFLGHQNAVEFLLDNGAQIDVPATNPAFPVTPLHSALSAGHKAIAMLLLARGADVNVREGGGMTVLHEAAGLGKAEYVNLLLERGANPGARTDDGKLPEDFARERKFGPVADLLTSARARR